MCIAICVAPGKKLTKAQMINCHASNKDGCGFAYISTDILGHSKIKMYKTMDFNKFLHQYERAVKNNPESPFIVHFRIATHGTVDKFNCHPFKVNKRMAMIHNGIIAGVGVDPKKSDTQLFNEKVLKKLPKGWEKNEAIGALIEKFIVGSKVLILNIDGTVNIYNESLGHWKDGIWFSNYSYVSSPVVTVYSQNFQRGNYYKAPKIKDLPCDGCSKMENPWRLDFYETMGGDLLAYCPTCNRKALALGEVKKSEGISRWIYEEKVNSIFDEGEFAHCH